MLDVVKQISGAPRKSTLCFPCEESFWAAQNACFTLGRKDLKICLGEPEVAPAPSLAPEEFFRLVKDFMSRSCDSVCNLEKEVFVASAYFDSYYVYVPVELANSLYPGYRKVCAFLSRGGVMEKRPDRKSFVHSYIPKAGRQKHLRFIRTATPSVMALGIENMW